MYRVVGIKKEDGDASEKGISIGRGCIDEVAVW